MRSLMELPTGSNATSLVMPAARIRPAFWRRAARYQREAVPVVGAHESSRARLKGPVEIQQSRTSAPDALLTRREDGESNGVRPVCRCPSSLRNHPRGRSRSASQPLDMAWLGKSEPTREDCARLEGGGPRDLLPFPSREPRTIPNSVAYRIRPRTRNTICSPLWSICEASVRPSSAQTLLAHKRLNLNCEFGGAARI